MKVVKSLAVILSILCLTVITGCSSSDETSHSNDDKKQSVEKPNSKEKSYNQADKSTDTSTKQSQSNQNESDQNKNDQEKEVKKDKDGLIIAQDPQSVLVLVNKTHKLPDGYVPPNLIFPDVRFPYSDMIEKRQVRKVTAEALKKMFKAADQAGFTLYGESGYRSYDRQVGIFDRNVDKYGAAKASTISAHPGTSEHQTGLSIDITSQDMLNQSDPLVQSFGETDAGKWVENNAHKYGFIIRYPKGKEDITGYEYEPWHIRYVGVDAATTIYNKNETLEEYIQSLDQ